MSATVVYWNRFDPFPQRLRGQGFERFDTIAGTVNATIESALGDLYREKPEMRLKRQYFLPFDPAEGLSVLSGLKSR